MSSNMRVGQGMKIAYKLFVSEVDTRRQRNKTTSADIDQQNSPVPVLPPCLLQRLGRET